MSFLAIGLAVACVLLSALLWSRWKRSRRRLSKVEGGADAAQQFVRYEEDEFMKTVKKSFKAECERIAMEIDLNAEIEMLGYDPANMPSLSRFQPVVQQTHCYFAKKSKVWSSQPWDIDLSIEENVQKDINALELFTKAGKGYHLDGFLIEVPNPKCEQHWLKNPSATSNTITTPNESSCRNIDVDSIEGFAEVVRRVLTAICDADKMKFREGCMHVSEDRFSSKGWFFEFANESFFITTFAPFYPETGHARYSFGTTSGWILLQPEFSFVLNGIGNDTLQTNWDKPMTVRDKIRIDFKRNNREYDLFDTIYYSPAIDVIKPLKTGDPVVEWWKKKKPNNNPTDN